MLVKSLALRSFLSYRNKTELEFPGSGAVGIIGPNESGKSTLLKAIAFALYGKIPGPTSKDVPLDKLINDYADEDMLVEASLELAGSVLDIARGRTLAGEPILEVSGMSGKPSDVDRQLKEALVVGYHDFLSLYYFVQGDIHQFMTGDKREYFGRWASGLAWWEKIETETRRESRKLEIAIATTERDLDEISQLTSIKDRAQERLKSASKAMQATAELLRSLGEMIADLKAELINANAAEPAKCDASSPTRDSLLSTLRVLESTLASCSRELKNIESGACPLLNVACSKLDVKRAEARGATADKMKDLEDQIADMKEQLKALPKSQAIKAREVILLRAELKARIKELAGRYDRHETELRRAQQEYAGAEYDLKQVSKAEARQPDLAKKLEDDRRLLARCKVVETMCGKSGLPRIILGNEMKLVEERCNWILERLDYQKRIRFSAVKVLNRMERCCHACGTIAFKNGVCSACGAERQKEQVDEPTITILDNGAERSFHLESGGAQVLESFAVRLACSMFVASMLGTESKMIMLDEVFSNLDARNRQALLSLVMSWLEQHLGIQQQFVITHSEDILGAFSNLIIVSKDRRGCSTARWA